MRLRSILGVLTTVVSALLIGTLAYCTVHDKWATYPNVAIGDTFDHFGFDGHFIKLPNDYAIEVVFGEGNTVYKIINYDYVMNGAVKAFDGDVKLFSWYEDLVFFKCALSSGEVMYVSLDTTDEVRYNVTSFKEEHELLVFHNMNVVNWTNQSLWLG